MKLAVALCLILAVIVSPAAAKMQFVQDEPGRITLRVVPLDGVEHQSLSDSIVSRANAELGTELEVTVELVPEIPRTTRGKFRTVVSAVDARPA